jgi:hypothetical protein
MIRKMRSDSSISQYCANNCKWHLSRSVRDLEAVRVLSNAQPSMTLLLGYSHKPAWLRSTRNTCKIRIYCGHSWTRCSRSPGHLLLTIYCRHALRSRHDRGILFTMTSPNPCPNISDSGFGSTPRINILPDTVSFTFNLDPSLSRD